MKEFIISPVEESTEQMYESCGVPELVRCKDCTYRHEQKGTCHNPSSICFGQYIHNKWFCADGKRRTECGW